MKKAKIDLLDIGDEFEAVSSDEISAEQSAEEPQIDLQGESFLAGQAEEPSPGRFSLLLKRVLVFGVPLLLLLMVAASVYYFVFYDGKSAVETAKKQTTAAAPAVIISVDFPNLRTVVNDAQGKQHVLLFGFAVSLGKEISPNLTAEDRELRSAVAHMVGGMPYSELLHDKGREQIKKRIKAHIEEQKGTGSINDVWITSWTLL